MLFGQRRIRWRSMYGQTVLLPESDTNVIYALDIVGVPPFPRLASSAANVLLTLKNARTDTALAKRESVFGWNDRSIFPLAIRMQGIVYPSRAARALAARRLCELGKLDSLSE